MKATKTSREAADFVEVRKNKDNVTYSCLKCGFMTEANAYYETDYKTMLCHVASCDGQGIPPGPRQTQSNPTITKDVQLYGGGAALKYMAWRIKNCVPGGSKLQDHEAMSLAQVSLATGLNPFIGEVWYIPGKGPMGGIRGLRRRAREQSTYTTTLRAMRDEEITEHDVKPGDVGRICELFRHDVLQRTVEINKAAGKMVIPVKPILGIGIWRQKDQIASSKSSTWMADKRAEADALRKGFDLSELPYSDEVNGSRFEVGDAEDAGWSVAPEKAEAIRREAALNAERHARGTNVPEMARDFSDVIAKYKNGELETPPWVQEIREAAEAHPQSSDPVDNGSFVKQLEVSASRKVSVEQFRAFVEIVLTHPLNDVTFGGAAILMDVINSKDFEAQVIGLLS